MAIAQNITNVTDNDTVYQGGSSDKAIDVSDSQLSRLNFYAAQTPAEAVRIIDGGLGSNEAVFLKVSKNSVYTFDDRSKLFGNENVFFESLR